MCVQRATSYRWGSTYPLRTEGLQPMSATTFRKIQLEKLEVVLVMKSLKVEGTIHVEPSATASRFSDAWDGFLRMHDRHRFFPVTDARVTTHEADKPVATAPFMVVDRDEVIGVFPQVAAA